MAVAGGLIAFGKAQARIMRGLEAGLGNSNPFRVPFFRREISGEFSGDGDARQAMPVDQRMQQIAHSVPLLNLFTGVADVGGSIAPLPR